MLKPCKSVEKRLVRIERRLLRLYEKKMVLLVEQKEKKTLFRAWKIIYIYTDKK